MQATEIALFCMWKQVDHCYYLAFSLCGSLHSKDVPKDDVAVQAAMAEWLNGLVEKVRRTLYVISDYDCIS